MTSAISDVELLPGYYVDRWKGTGAWCTLPWPVDPAGRDVLLRRSLGPLVIRWAEGDLEDTHGPGLIHHLTGEPWRFTPGQKRYLIRWYEYDPATGRWVWRRGVKRGAKGTGKDPFGAALCDIEFIGPCRLVRDEETGLWTGVRHRMPLVQVMSNSEAQSKDLLRVANAMLPRRTREYFGIDCGETRTILSTADESGGRMEIPTASEKTAEGDPATFIFLNETHHMTSTSGGHTVAAVARRNVGKSPADVQARVCEGTNAHQQGSDSVAEKSYEAWQLQVSGRTKRVDILYDSIEAPPDVNMADEDDLMRGLAAAYMDAPWSDLERLAGEAMDPDTSIADLIRYYLNGLAAAQDAWVDPWKWEALKRPSHDEDGKPTPYRVDDREQIAMFLDCSKSFDATGLVACRISDGHVFVLGVWERPPGKRGDDWLAPRDEVEAVIRAAFGRYRVVWFGADPSPAKDDETAHLYWMSLLDAIHRDFGKKLPVWAMGGAKIGHSVLFDMRIKTPGGGERNRVFTQAAMQTARDIDEDGALTWDGHPKLRTHTLNAKRRPNPWGVSLGKVTRDSSKHVDLAVCMVGARMGRRLALNSGKVRQRARTGKAVF